jgi:hypothetical protein
VHGMTFEQAISQRDGSCSPQRRPSHDHPARGVTGMAQGTGPHRPVIACSLCWAACRRSRPPPARKRRERCAVPDICHFAALVLIVARLRSARIPLRSCRRKVGLQILDIRAPARLRLNPAGTSYQPRSRLRAIWLGFASASVSSRATTAFRAAFKRTGRRPFRSN